MLYFSVYVDDVKCMLSDIDTSSQSLPNDIDFR